MKLLHFAGLVLGIIVLGSSPVFAGNEALPWEQKLPFESGVIRYTLDGIEKGEEIVYFRNWGRERATYHESVAEMMGVRSRKSEVELKTPDAISTFDLAKKEGIQEVNPLKMLQQEFNKLSPAEQKKVRKTMRQMTIAGPAGREGDIVENAVSLLGYRCDKVMMMGGMTAYLIHNTDIALKTEMDMAGMKMLSVAISLKTGPVDGKYFVPPVGIIPETDMEAEKLTRQMSVETMAMLKDPNVPRRHGPPPMMGPIGPPPPPPPGVGGGDMAEGNGETPPMLMDPMPPR